MQKSTKFSDSDIYFMVMLHSYQHKSRSEIAKQFGVTQGEVYEIISRRTNSGCCG
jgi:transposase